MTDRKITDEWPGNEPRDGKGGRRRGSARGLHLQQIVEPGEEEAYNGVGTQLRAERERRQASLADIAGILRIQQAHLSALEEGRTDDLPGPTYAIGFLRTYSEFLGFDGDEIIRQFKREATLVPVERRIVVPEPLDEARRPGLRLALVSLLVAGGVYGGWIFLEQQGLLPVEVVADPPERLAPYQAATDVVKTAPKADAANVASSPPAPETAAADAVDNNASAAAAAGVAPVADNAGAIAETTATETTATESTATETTVTETTATETGAGQAQTDAPDTRIANGAAAEATAETTAETATGTVSQAAVTTAPESDTGRPAVAADADSQANTAEAPAAPAEADSGVSIGDMPAS
ncbi:MAG: hypothetical protein HN732_20375, partial [Rhodospirillaceae bacterium]|nr:hypothetical protein [Rhodospirillaceae bacterium]